MNPLQSAAQPLGVSHPMFRYSPTGEWRVTSRSLASPAADGSVAYFFDFLSKQYIIDDDESDPMAGDPCVIHFSDALASAACQYLSAAAMARGLEISDGPYIQMLEDDGAVPRGFMMVRAIAWADEFDLVVPADPESAAINQQLTTIEDRTAVAA